MAEQFLRIGGTDGKEARGLRTNKKGVMLVELEKTLSEREYLQMDFKGKITGDNFVPHTARRGNFTLEINDDLVTSPTPYSNGWEEINPSNYESISELNNFGAGATSTTNGTTPCMLFSFNLLEYLKRQSKIPKYYERLDLTNILSSFEIRWNGRETSSGSGVILQIWIPWENGFSRTTRSHNSNENEDLVLPSTAVTENPVTLVDEDGYVHILVRTIDSVVGGNERRVFTNYIEIKNMSVITDYIATSESRAFDDKHRAQRVYIVNKEEKPFARDEEQDRYKVTVEDSTTRKAIENIIRFDRQPTQIETLFEGELNPGESVSNIYCFYQGEKETRILVNVDIHPWRMLFSAGPFVDHFSSTNFRSGTMFPNTFNFDEEYPDERDPLHVLPIYRNGIQISENTTWTDVYPHRQLNDFRVTFGNLHETEAANVKIKVMRIFK